MSGYKLIVCDGSGQDGRIYDARATTLIGAKREAGRLARNGYVGGYVAVFAAHDERRDVLYKAVRS